MPRTGKPPKQLSARDRQASVVGFTSTYPSEASVCIARWQYLDHGSCVGEISLILGCTHVASVVATFFCDLLFIGKKELMKVSDPKWMT